MSDPITSHRPGFRFTVRVAAVIIDQCRVLLHRSEQDDFWSLPGGQVELLEPSREALQREFREEAGQTLQVDRLVWVVENFFTVGGEQNQELGLYFLAHLDPASTFLTSSGPFAGIENSSQPDLRLTFQWVPLDPVLLAQMDIQPDFLRGGLAHLPEVTKHVINLGTQSL